MIKVSVVGTGMNGRSHINFIQREFRGTAEISGICDTNQHELELGRKLCLTGAKVFTDYKSVINDMGTDAIVISTPNFLHAEIAIAALKAGKHVLMEKPLATKKEDVFRLLEASRKYDPVLMVGLELRYSAYFNKIKQLIEGNEIGKPRFTWCKEFRGPFLPKVDNWIQDSRRCGGVLVDKDCHHFDLMTWFLDARPVRVSAFGGKDVVSVTGDADEVKDNAMVIVEYDNGTRACLMLCMFTMPPCLELGVIGDKGRIETREGNNLLLMKYPMPSDIRIDENRQPVRLRKGDSTALFHVPPYIHESEGHGGFYEEHNAFFDAINGGNRPQTSIERAMYSTLIPLAAEEAMITGKIIEL